MNNTTITTTEDLNRHFAENGFESKTQTIVKKLNHLNDLLNSAIDSRDERLELIYRYQTCKIRLSITDEEYKNAVNNANHTIHKNRNDYIKTFYSDIMAGSRKQLKSNKKVPDTTVTVSNEAGMLAFSEACYDQNSLSELQEALFLPADDTDMKEWQISSEEYYVAIKEAIESKMAE